ncbi:hypothetical protein CRYUN_Cryun17cG0058200 [Craigia yunnanensis]
METQKIQPNKLPSSAASTPMIISCRKKKNEKATFLVDLKDHIDEFINASMDEHKTCFKKTIEKVLPLIFCDIIILYELSCWLSTVIPIIFT